MTVHVYREPVTQGAIWSSVYTCIRTQEGETWPPVFISTVNVTFGVCYISGQGSHLVFLVNGARS